MDDLTARWEPEDDDEYESATNELKERFAAWAAETGVALDREAPEGLLHYKWGYLDGHLTRWTRRHLSEILLELYPAKVIVEADELDEVLAEAEAFVTFLAEAELLDEASEPVEVLVEHIRQIAGQYRANMADPSLYSFGKRLWAKAGAEGVRLDDPEALEAFIARFNARPRAERDTVVSGGVKPEHRPAVTGRFTPPGTKPQSGSRKRQRRRR